MASEEVCREQYEYLKDGHLWEMVIPRNMREYARDCKNLGEEKQEEEEMEGEYQFEAYGF